MADLPCDKKTAKKVCKFRTRLLLPILLANLLVTRLAGHIQLGITKLARLTLLRVSEAGVNCSLVVSYQLQRSNRVVQLSLNLSRAKVHTQT